MEDGQVKRCVPVRILGVDRRTFQNEFMQNVGLSVLRSGVHEKPGILRVEQLRQSPPPPCSRPNPGDQARISGRFLPIELEWSFESRGWIIVIIDIFVD